MGWLAYVLAPLATDRRDDGVNALADIAPILLCGAGLLRLDPWRG